MDTVKNILTNTNEETLDSILSPFIQEQFPGFIREDHPKLILLIKAYYEWMDEKGNPGNVLSKLDTVNDIDANADEFYSHFKNTFLASFPEIFAEDELGNKPNKKTLLKKIRDFYGKKGTESAYKFLFRILYDSDLEFYYPKTDILKASDGQWIEPKSIKTTANNGVDLFSAKGGQILQAKGNGQVATAFVDSVAQYTFEGSPVCEFFLNNIVGDFVPDLPVKIQKDDKEWQEVPYSVLGQFFIEVSGNGYQIGDNVTVLNTVGGTGLSAKIEQVGLAGNIKKIAITNSGINYPADVIVSVFNTNGKQTAKVVALRTAITNYPGYFSGNRGKISANKNIHDGHYYQDFSYKLKAAVSFDTYFDVLKRIIHPAGMRMFGSVLVRAAVDNTLTTSTQGTFSKVPLIGQYTPYTPRTYNNLRNGIFLPNQVRGATLQVWLSTYSVAGNSASGATSGWEVAGITALGVNRWIDLARGVTYSIPNGDVAEQTVWSAPRFKQEAVNTHPSLVIRPINESGSDFGATGSSTNSSWRSYGYWSGLTVGALGLSAARSYFVVAKGRTATPIGAISTPTTSRYLISDVGGHHGIVVGSTAGTSALRVLAYNDASPISSNNVITTIPGGVGEWFMVCSTYNGTPAANGALSLFVNGVCAGTQTSAGQNASINGQTLAVGMASGIDSVFDGEIAEVICYQGDVGKADREKVEGYLAHKYGLAGKLPSTHPFKNTVPGGSYSSGRWYGNTGDYYQLGYNPYIGSTTQVGRDGTTAPLGSLFVDSGLGYTFTVASEHGITSHNPTGSPLGSTAAWWDNGASGSNKETVLDPSHIRGLALWLKPENIGVCGSVANGVSTDVWHDASPFQNHALPPTWGRFNGNDYASAGVTIDKLRPVLSVGSLAGPTGVCFNGGVLYSPSSVWNGASLASWVQFGNTHGVGCLPDKFLTGQHLHLKNGLTLTDDMDVFVVLRSTSDEWNSGLGVMSSQTDLRSVPTNDTVFFHRSYNIVDRTPSLQTDQYYKVSPNNTLLYPSNTPVGLAGFRPSGGSTTAAKNSIAYDPHVSGVCFGVGVCEWSRDKSGRIRSYLNGDEGLNFSKASGRRIASVVSADPYSQFIQDGNVLYVSADSASAKEYANNLSKNLLDSFANWKETPVNILNPVQNWIGDGGGTSRAIGWYSGMTEPWRHGGFYEITPGTSRNIYLNNGTNNTFWDYSFSYIGSGGADSWTFSVLLRRIDSAVWSSSVINGMRVYLYTNPDPLRSSVPATVTNLGGGWYRVSATRTFPQATVEKPILVGVTGFESDVKYYLSEAQLLPYVAGDIRGDSGKNNSFSWQSSPYSVLGGHIPNSIMWDTNPWGFRELIWDIKPHNTTTTQSDGGWNSPLIDIDPTKTYRFSVWLNRKNLGADGSFYFGTYGYDSAGNNVGVIQSSNGANSTNPYFISFGPSDSRISTRQDKWVLVVGHIHPAGTATGTAHANSGFYDVGNSTKYGSISTDYIWRSDNAKTLHRAYLYYTSDRTVRQQFLRPRLEVVDGTEPSIADLVNNRENIIDESGTSGRKLIAANAPRWSEAGVGGAFEFRNNDDKLFSSTSIPWGDGQVSWEAAVWTEPSWLEPNSGVFANFYSNGQVWLSIGANSLAASWSILKSNPEPGYNSQKSISFSTGSTNMIGWNHVVVTTSYDGEYTTGSIYLNGKLLGSQSWLGKMSTGTSGVQQFYGGRSLQDRRSDGYSYHNRCKIAYGRVYNRPLNSEEVSHNYRVWQNRLLKG